MKLLSILFLVAFTANASDLFLNFTHFSDDGGEFKYTTFKVDTSKMTENSAISCSFRALDAEDFVEFNVIRMNKLYIASASESTNGDSLSRNGAAMSKSLETLFASYDAGDGYVFRTLIMGSKTMLKEYSKLISMDDGPMTQNEIDLANAKELKFDQLYNILIEGESYEASCELEQESDL